MYLEKNVKNTRSSTIFAVLGLAMMVFLTGVSVNAQTVATTRVDDFVGDNRTDFSTVVYASNTNLRWKITGNPASAAPNAALKREFDFGLEIDTAAGTGDSIVTGDYVGDSKSDPAVYRDTNSTFYVANFPTGTGGVTLNKAVVFGNGATDFNAPGDYDGDGKTDYCTGRVASGNVINWFILSSSTNTVKTITFGSYLGSSVPATIFPGADFNADGRDELVYVTSNTSGTVVNYFIGDANTGAGVITRSFGVYNTDFSVAPRDYTGDGRADFVAVRQSQGSQSVWYIQNSQTGAVTATAFGIADSTFGGGADSPVRGDFDGDGRQDICVWRSSNQTFYYISSQNGSIQSQKSGDSGDTPTGSFALF